MLSVSCMRAIIVIILNPRLSTRGGDSRIHLNLMARCWIRQRNWVFQPILIVELPVQLCRRFGRAPTGHSFLNMAVRASGLLATHISAELPNGLATALHIRRRVPSRRQLANHQWMLVSDLILKFNTTAGTSGPLAWGDPSPAAAIPSLPAHKKALGNLPAGGNEGFADGSVSWNKAETMYNFYSTNRHQRAIFIFIRSDLGTFPMTTANPNKFPN